MVFILLLPQTVCINSNCLYLYYLRAKTKQEKPRVLFQGVSTLNRKLQQSID